MTYTGLPGYTCRNHNNFGTGKSFLQAVIRRKVSLDLGGGRDVGQISSYTGSVHNIIKTKLYTTSAPIASRSIQINYLRHQRIRLQKQRQRLANTTCLGAF